MKIKLFKMKTLFFLLFFVLTGYSNVFAQSKTAYEKKVFEIKVNYLSIFYYGYEKELTLPEKYQIESLIKDKSKEQEAGVLANLVTNYAMSHSKIEMDNLLKRFQNEMKNAEKLKTDFDLSSSKKNNSTENLSFSTFNKTYVDKQLKKWQEKGEFEKTSDWQIRVNEETTKKKIELFNENAIDAYAEYLHIRLYFCAMGATLKLGSYDADKEIYTIISKHFGDIPLSVPLAEAESFKGSFCDDRYDPQNVYYFILNDKLALATATFRGNNDKKYKYENSLAKNRKKQAKEIYSLAKNHFENKEYLQAINYYEEIIYFDTELIKSDDWEDLSLAYYQTENYSKVIDCYNNYKSRSNTRFDNYFILATSYFKLNKYSEAIEIYSELSNLGSLALEIEKHNNMAECYIAIGNHNMAIDFLERFISNSRHNAKTYLILGNAYKAAKNNKKAKEAYKMAATNGSKEAQNILNKN